MYHCDKCGRDWSGDRCGDCDISKPRPVSAIDLRPGDVFGFSKPARCHFLLLNDAQVVDLDTMSLVEFVLEGDAKYEVAGKLTGTVFSHWTSPGTK